MPKTGQSLELKFALYTLAATATVVAWAFICNFINTTFNISNPVGQLIIAIAVGFVAFKIIMAVRTKTRKDKP